MSTSIGWSSNREATKRRLEVSVNTISSLGIGLLTGYKGVAQQYRRVLGNGPFVTVHRLVSPTAHISNLAKNSADIAHFGTSYIVIRRGYLSLTDTSYLKD